MSAMKTHLVNPRRLISVLGAATVGAALLASITVTATATGNDVAGATSSQKGAATAIRRARCYGSASS